jgi:hypothetical protein
MCVAASEQRWRHEMLYALLGSFGISGLLAMKMFMKHAQKPGRMLTLPHEIV